MDHVPDPASSATAWERLFLECDKQGRVLWMNARARARLGAVDSLLSALPTSHLPQASQLLNSTGSGRPQALWSTLQPADRPAPIPVQLIRLLSLDDRVVLSAEVRARASDGMPPRRDASRVLLELQSRAARNYFRLLEAQQALESHHGRSRSTVVVASRASEMERKRIAGELHSSAGQLGGIYVNLEVIAELMPEPVEGVRKSLERIRLLTEQTVNELRSISHRWYPPDDRLDLARAIEWYWKTTAIPEKFHATLELHPIVSDVPDIVRATVYRVVQEGLANVVRHSRATEVKLELGVRDDQIYLVLEDNGSGFDTEKVLEGAPTREMHRRHCDKAGECVHRVGSNRPTYE